MRRLATLALAASLSVPTTSAQWRFAEMPKAHLPPVANRTDTLALGDLDGDGDSDLVCGNNYQQNKLYLNDGNGTFADATAAKMPPDSDLTYSLALGDVDGDGDLDLVWAKYWTNKLYLNDGKGTFTDVTAAKMPQDSDFTAALALGDVDGDGDLDLVFGNHKSRSGPPQNKLYLNDGEGTFTDVTAAKMPKDSDLTFALVLGDVDGDGDLDLVGGNGSWGTGQQNKLYLNDGKGTFTDVTATNMPKESDSTYALALGDLDGDGDLDLVGGNVSGAGPQRAKLYLNDGKGMFTDVTAAKMPSKSGHTFAVTLGDVDGDGDLDVVCGSHEEYFGDQNKLYLNDGNGTFADVTAAKMPKHDDNTHAVALDDVDGDRDLDLVCGNNWERNKLYLNDGKGTFTDATAARLPKDSDDTHALALGDVDEDGDLDLVCGNVLWRTQQRNKLYQNDGKGAFADVTAAKMPVDSDDTHALALGDVDGDGDLDLVCGNDGQNRLFQNDGKGTFTDVTTAKMPKDSDHTIAVALADVDGDGDLDLVCANGGQNRLYLNDGKGTFADMTATKMPMDSGFASAVVLGDADGDGDLDMFVGNRSEKYGWQNKLCLNDGKGTFTDATATRLPEDNDRTLALTLGDVDGDGDLDLLCGNGPFGYPRRGWQSRLYLNDGKGTFTDATATRLPKDEDETLALALDDVDGDGDLDLVLGNGGRQNRLWQNDGKGTFADVTAAQMPSDSNRTRALALGDVDGDGDLDLLSGNADSAGGLRNKLYLNLLRQIDARYLSILGREYRLDYYSRTSEANRFCLVVPFVADAEGRTLVPPLGTWGLEPSRTVTLPLLVIPPNTGMASIGSPVPNDAGLVGRRIYSQALVIPDLAWSIASWRFTNTNADRVLRL